MNRKTEKYSALILAMFLLLMLNGCSVFISTPQVTRIQIQGVDDQLREYIITLDDPKENSLSIQVSDRYSLQFDFEWLWNSENNSDMYYELNAEDNSPALAPWMMCKYRF